MNRHRAAVALVFVSACTVGRTSSGDPAASRAVVAAMEHYTALIRAVASDSIAAMYTEDGELLEAGMAPLRGPREIREFLARPISGDLSLRWPGCRISHRGNSAAGT